MFEPGRCAIVTGAADGIGWAAARRLGELGVGLSLADCNRPRLDARERELADAGAKVVCHEVDVTDDSALERMVRSTLATFGRIDILVNVAGGSGPKNLLDIESIPLEVWDAVFAVNLRSTFALCRLVVPHMRARRYGRIVNTGSMLAYGRHGPIGTAGARLPYAAAKAGLLGFTAQLAKDLGEFAITVNTVLPGLTVGEPGTRMRERYEAMGEEARAKFVERYPMRRPAQAEEVAAAIVFLSSDAASYVSGQGLSIDGAAW